MQSSRHQRTTQQNNEENGGGGKQNQCQSTDYNLAMILAGIVIVFCICHSLRVFLAFYYVSVVERTNQCTEKGEETSHPFRLYIISALNHLMLVVNSSINFIIYCAVGSKFRKVLKDKFFPASMRSSSGALRTNQIEIQQLNGHVMNRPSPRKETQIELREDHEDNDHKNYVLEGYVFKPQLNYTLDDHKEKGHNEIKEHLSRHVDRHLDKENESITSHKRRPSSRDFSIEQTEGSEHNGNYGVTIFAYV